MRHSRIGMAVAILCLHAGAALAIPNPDTGPGCGLGKKLWSDSMNQKNILPQAFMATTNVTGFHTFAISSGTSGCSNDGVLWADKKAEAFVAANYDDLVQEMAQGSGEHLASLASLIGVRDERRAEFFSITQGQYHRLTQSEEHRPDRLLPVLYEELRHRGDLISQR